MKNEENKLLTKAELVNHIKTWRNDMVDDINQTAGKSLLDAELVGLRIKGLTNDMVHIYNIVLDIAQRLPEVDELHEPVGKVKRG